MLQSSGILRYNEIELHHEKILHMYAKTKAQISFAVTAKLISTIVFATGIVHNNSSKFLNLKFQGARHLCLYRSVCVIPVRKPHCWFSHDMAQFKILTQ